MKFVSYEEAKNKELFFIEEVSVKSPDELITMFEGPIMDCFSQLYQDEFFVMRELIKCFMYYQIHPIKTPRNRRHWVIASMRWLENAWAKSEALRPGA